MSKKVRRLFAAFVPKHYILDLTPNRDDLTFSGSVVIAGQKTGRPSQRLTFHQNGLTITGARITKHDKKGDREIAVTRVNHHGSYSEVRLHAGEMIYPGAYTVTMEFTGTITRSMEGIYPCFFKHNGQEKRLIATQFESHHARDAFPCIDEPEAKATFDLTLITPAGETVIANTPIKKQHTDGNLQTTRFETTPRMSTYLLAFVFGQLEHLEKTTKHGVVVRTYATPDNIAHTGFALDCAVKTLEYYNDYYDTPYPLAKCDLIALPDFATGAMENWGCITFREQGLIFDPKNTSQPLKQYVAMVIAHELAHQWFGNLVTMKWWNDLWLNEGFATWMSFLAVDTLFPGWKFWTQFISDDQQYGLKLDSLENTHPVEVTVNHPDEIRTIFDAISYEKGASCIHMLARYLGEEIFRDGLRYYLKKHAYGNTVTTDLWDALETVSGKPVRQFMTAWTTQAGFPLVRANIQESHAHLTQESFLFNPKHRQARQKAKTQTLWPIALRPNRDFPAELFDTEEIKVAFKKQSVPLVLNQEHSGFYRIAYNASHLELLGNEIKAGRLSVLDRLGMLTDVFDCAKAGYMGTAEALTFLEAYHNETHHAVWDIIAGNLASVRLIMGDDKLRETMKPYIRNLIKSELARLGWQEHAEESLFDRLLRPTILGLAAGADEPAVVAECQKRFNTMKTPADIPPDLRGVVYSSVARKGNAQTFDRLLTLHNQSISSEERNSLCAALTNFEQPELIQKSLELIQSENVRLQDIMYWVAYSFGNRHARKQTWDWMVKNWQWLEEHIGKDLGFYRMPVYAARVISDASFLPTFEAFFAKVAKPALDRSIKQAVEMIEWQSAWRERDFEAIKKFFASRSVAATRP